MATKIKTYTEQFKIQTVELMATSGKTMQEIADDLGVSKATLSIWKREYGAPAVRKPRGKRQLSELELELEKLRKENANLKMEREILKNQPDGAANFFDCRNTLICGLS